MRFISVLFLLSFGCSEYELHGPDPAIVIDANSNDQNTTTTEIDLQTDTEFLSDCLISSEDKQSNVIREPDECGRTIQSGRWEDTDGDGVTEPIIVDVESGVSIFPRSPDHLVVSLGTTPSYDVDICAWDCGPVEVHGITWLLEDPCNHGWLADVAGSAQMDYPEGQESYEDSSYYPHQVYGDQFVSSFTEPFLQHTGSDMISVTLQAGECKTFRLVNDATADAPIGTDYRLSVKSLFWTDLTTGDLVSHDSWFFVREVDSIVSVRN